jgi:hypothetical protein
MTATLRIDVIVVISLVKILAMNNTSYRKLAGDKSH